MIEDVIAGVRESFIDEGVDEQVLQELKQIWETKLMASKAVELNPDPPEPQVPQINTHKTVSVNKGILYLLETNIANISKEFLLKCNLSYTRCPTPIRSVYPVDCCYM